MKDTLRRVGERLLPAVAYGDAIGLPTETMHARDVEQRYGQIRLLVPPEHNKYYQGDYPAGTTSDDTQLSVAVTEALLAADDFTIASQAAKHVEVFNLSPQSRDEHGVLRVSGWGRSTTASMERLVAGVSPAESGEVGGRGNGIIMKMAPLVYWQAVRQTSIEKRHSEYDRLTTMTHDDDAVRACTRLHGDVLYELYRNPHTPLSQFVDRVDDIIRRESLADPKGRIARAVYAPAGSFDGLVVRYAAGRENGHYGFIVWNTLAMAYDVFLSAKGDYGEAVRYAANLGGDSDSIASIVGTMCNAWSGGEFVAPPDFEQTQDYDKVRAISVQLATRALALTSLE